MNIVLRVNVWLNEWFLLHSDHYSEILRSVGEHSSTAPSVFCVVDRSVVCDG